jgi:hypothetical protein
MRPDVFGLEFQFAGTHYDPGEALHFRTPPPEIDNWLTAPLNGIKHLQSEAKLPSKKEPHAKRP